MRFLFISSLIILLVACDSQQSNNNADSQDLSVSVENNIINWPVIKDKESISVSDNLLAQNYYVVFDGSGSMSSSRCAAGQSKLAAAKASLALFAQSVPADANLGLAVFNSSGINEIVSLQKDRSQFTQKLANITSGGSTPLNSSISLAFTKLEEQGRRQLGYGEYHLVVVTDGEASSGEDPRSVVNQILATSPIVVHTIGFCIDTDHSLNQPGKTFYRAADNPQDLQAGLQAVLAEAPSFSVSDFSDPK